MTEHRALYEKVILDHNRSPRNFGKLPDPDFQAEGYNALCGDHFTVYVRMDGDRIKELMFDGAGCAISKSSASIMTTELLGKTRAEAEAIFDRFKGMITSDPKSPLEEKSLGKLAIFGGIREFPVRAKCATLAWHTALSALRGQKDAISTE